MKPLDPLTVELSGTALIEASAGTGKTYTITTLYLRLLLERRLDASQILVVTYTNAATAELRDRVRRRLREALLAFRSDAAGADATLSALLDASRGAGRVERDGTLLEDALRAFDEAAIFTIHGFCQRMLQDNAFESGVAFDAELMTSEDLLRDEVVRDFWARELGTEPEIVVRHLQDLGVDLETLLRLAKQVIESPRMAVLPEPEVVDFADLVQPFEAAHAAAAAIWRRDREQVVARLLDDSAGLDRSGYQRRWIPGWAARLDIELAEPRAGRLRTFEQLRKFGCEALAAATKPRGRTPTHEFFTACDRLLAACLALAQALDRRVMQLRLSLVRYAREETRRRKAEAERQSFDDLLHRLAEALASSEGEVLAARIRERYRAALIDEFQDTDRVQYDIFRRVHGSDEDHVLFLIGDPKQAIYAFRGADVFTYVEAKGDEPDRQYTLGTNWRSDPTLIDAVNALFGRPQSPFLFEAIPFLAVGPRPGATDRLGGSARGSAPLEILLVPGDGWRAEALQREIPGRVAAEVSRFLASGAKIGDQPVGPGDVAVLCRTNRQARESQEALRSLLVPTVLQGDSSVFETAEAAEVQRVLAAMADPHDAALLRSALATTLVGLDSEALLRLQTDERAWDDTVRRFLDLGETWTGRGFVAAFRRMLDVESVQRKLLELVDGERRLTNVLHLGELLQSAAAETRRGPLALVEWLHRMRLDPAAAGDLAAEAVQIRLESDARAVKLTTIHQAKGLEYPIVYCPFLWGAYFDVREGKPVRFHDPADGTRLTLDLGAPLWEEHRELYRREELAESLRLLYVALTRAKHRCTVVWASVRGGEASALGYVLHGSVPRAFSQRAEDLPVRELTDVVAGRVRTEAGVRSEVERIAAASGGAIAVRDLAAGPGEAYAAPREEAGSLVCRTAERTLTTRFRTSSFTGLAASRGMVSEPAAEGVDHDEAADDEAPHALPPAAARIALHEFPRGARAGNVVHKILEGLDFTSSDSAAIEVAVRRALAGHGFAERWAEPLGEAIGAFLATPVGEGPAALELRGIERGRRRSEMEFLFRVASTDAAALTASRLADVFARHGAPRKAPEYAARIRRLAFEPLAGFLRGYIDLVFEHGGRWYLADYKSNFLGPAPSDYGPARLLEAMAHHHYFLQYHLYAVALDRHLGARLPGYDRGRDFGGVYYFFLRGMSPAHPPGTGVFFDRPSPALIGDLSAALGEST